MDGRTDKPADRPPVCRFVNKCTITTNNNNNDGQWQNESMFGYHTFCLIFLIVIIYYFRYLCLLLRNIYNLCIIFLGKIVVFPAFNHFFSFILLGSVVLWQHVELCFCLPNCYLKLHHLNVEGGQVVEYWRFF